MTLQAAAQAPGGPSLKSAALAVTRSTTKRKDRAFAGVVERKAGAISTFAYSDAVKKSSVVWTEAILDKWLTDPEAVIPDNDMAFRLNNPVERAAIIAFLKETGK